LSFTMLTVLGIVYLVFKTAKNNSKE
jgi:hypothetical protein